MTTQIQNNFDRVIEILGLKESDALEYFKTKYEASIKINQDIDIILEILSLIKTTYANVSIAQGLSKALTPNISTYEAYSKLPRYRLMACKDVWTNLFNESVTSK